MNKWSLLLLYRVGKSETNSNTCPGCEWPEHRAVCVSRLQLFIKQQLPADGHHVPSAARGHWAERRGHSGHQAASNPAGGAETAHTAVWEMSNNKSTTTTNAQTNTENFVFLSIFICRRTESDTWCFITEDQTVKLWLPSCAQRDTTFAAHTAVY